VLTVCLTRCWHVLTFGQELFLSSDGRPTVAWRPALCSPPPPPPLLLSSLQIQIDHAELGPLVGGARAGGPLLAARLPVDSVVFDLCRGPGMVAQVACSRASTANSSEKAGKI
jgi:hypothetical protein